MTNADINNMGEMQELAASIHGKGKQHPVETLTVAIAMIQSGHELSPNEDDEYELTSGGISHLKQLLEVFNENPDVMAELQSRYMEKE